MTWHINSSVAQGSRVALKVFQEYIASPAHDSALLEPNKKSNKKIHKKVFSCNAV